MRSRRPLGTSSSCRRSCGSTLRAASGLRWLGCLAAIPVLCLLLASPAEPTHEPHVGFYHWLEWRYDLPGRPDRHEYLPLTEWSGYGWAPPAVDVVLTAGARSELGSRGSPVRVLVRVDVKVSRPAFDAVAGRPDYAAMHRRARWRQVLAKKITVRGLRHGARIHLVSSLPLSKILNEAWRRDEWPLELRAEAKLTGSKQAKNLPVTLQGTLPIVTSD